ncbi:MAG: hypothetical protein ACOYL5_07690 [Phototrophicaceae bacterium]
MNLSFTERLTQIQAEEGTTWGLLLQPILTEMPAPMHFEDDPFFPFSRAIINATRDLVCAYVFDFAAYMVQGAAGAIALERSIAYVGAGTLKILDGMFATAHYRPMAYDAFGADAVTVADADTLAAFQAEGRTAFVIQQGNPAALEYPAYWLTKDRLSLPSGEYINVASKTVLYTSYSEDFAEDCRNALIALKSGK